MNLAATDIYKRSSKLWLLDGAGAGTGAPNGLLLPIGGCCGAAAAPPKGLDWAPAIMFPTALMSPIPLKGSAIPAEAVFEGGMLCIGDCCAKGEAPPAESTTTTLEFNTPVFKYAHHWHHSAAHTRTYFRGCFPMRLLHS